MILETDTGDSYLEAASNDWRFLYEVADSHLRRHPHGSASVFDRQEGVRIR